MGGTKGVSVGGYMGFGDNSSLLPTSHPSPKSNPNSKLNPDPSRSQTLEGTRMRAGTNLFERGPAAEEEVGQDALRREHRQELVLRDPKQRATSNRVRVSVRVEVLDEQLESIMISKITAEIMQIIRLVKLDFRDGFGVNERVGLKVVRVSKRVRSAPNVPEHKGRVLRERPLVALPRRVRRHRILQTSLSAQTHAHCDFSTTLRFNGRRTPDEGGLGYSG